MSDQAKAADTLREELEICGHEVDFSTLDLLDCLATAGLKLVEDDSGEASTAYFAKLKEKSA